MKSTASAQKAQEVTDLIQLNYWPKHDNQASEKIYHPQAYRQYLEKHGEPAHWLAALTPGRYAHQFDALGNALTILLDLTTSEQAHSLLNYGQTISNDYPTKLVPAFWPPIKETDWEWQNLTDKYHYKFSNAPYQYHNGGVWPMVNGWWGMALHAANKHQEAREILNSLNKLNRVGKDGEEWGFYEYANTKTGQPGGTYRIAWSAAAAIILENSLAGKTLLT